MSKIDVLKSSLQTVPELELAVLVGSQTAGAATEHSDRDIAIRWEKHIDGFTRMARSEALRRQIADAIAAHQDQID